MQSPRDRLQLLLRSAQNPMQPWPKQQRPQLEAKTAAVKAMSLRCSPAPSQKIETFPKPDLTDGGTRVDRHSTQQQVGNNTSQGLSLSDWEQHQADLTKILIARLLAAGSPSAIIRCLLHLRRRRSIHHTSVPYASGTPSSAAVCKPGRRWPKKNPLRLPLLPTRCAGGTDLAFAPTPASHLPLLHKNQKPRHIRPYPTKNEQPFQGKNNITRVTFDPTSFQVS